MVAIPRSQFKSTASNYNCKLYALATAFGYGKTNATSTVIHLQVGSTGAQVTALQTKLNSLGYSCGTVDGGFWTSNTIPQLYLSKRQKD